MQERDKFNTSCREHSVEIVINHVARNIAWHKDECPVCKIERLEQQLAIARREADESAKDAFRRGWKQAKTEISNRVADLAFKKDGEWLVFELSLKRDIAAMEYKEKAND